LIKSTTLWFTLLVSSAPALAAPSACDQPRGDVDGLYYLNKVYLQADKDLNESYGELVLRLDPGGKTKLKKSQLACSESRNGSCSYHDERGYYFDLKCVTDTTIERKNASMTVIGNASAQDASKASCDSG